MSQLSLSDRAKSDDQMAPLTKSQSKESAISDVVDNYLHPTHPLALTKGGSVSQETAPEAQDEQEGRGIDVIIHNMDADSDFTTLRKWSQLSIDRLFVNVAVLVAGGSFSIISLQASKYSFVAIVKCEKGWEEVGEKVITAVVE